MADAALGTVLRQLRGAAQARAQGDSGDRDLLERFLAGRDEAAFVALLRRHGPMVWGVCRRAGGGEQDAEDVFQATFLVLARKADSIRKRESVASWLHGVAHRLALQARRQGARRQARERRAADMRRKSRASDQAWQELQEALDAALRGVPEKYRAPLLLCYLEGKTEQEAARQLGCPLGTVRSRLARGRSRLRELLQRQGIRLSATASAAALAAGAAPAAPPARLLGATAKAGISYAANTAPAGLVSARVVALVQGGLTALKVTRLKTATAALLAAGVLGLGVALAFGAVAGPPRSHGGEAKPAAESSARGPADGSPHRDAASKATSARKTAGPAREVGDAGRTTPVSGRVVDPDGKPVAGAKLVVVGDETVSPAPQPATGPDGRFAFELPQPQMGYLPRHVLASAPGFGMDWVRVAGEPLADVTLRLVPDLRITGRVIDLQGRPVAGATVAVNNVFAGPPGAFEGMVRDWKKSADEQEQAARQLDRSLWTRGSVRKAFRTTTAADGSFTLDGYGQDRVVTLYVAGAGSADTFAAVATRTGFDPAGAPVTPLRLYPPFFTLVVAPDKLVTGTVRDALTKAPLAGVPVRGAAVAENLPFGSYLFHAWPEAEATTDAGGRFTLRGLAKSRRYAVVADPQEGTPHLHRFAEVPDTTGFDAAATTIDLPRGVVLSGRVTDAATGNGVRTRVFYRPLQKNELLEKFAGYTPDPPMSPWHRGRDTITDADGRYTLTVLPGAGLVAAQAVSGRRGAIDLADYLPARATKQDVADGVVDGRLGMFRVVGQGGYYNPEFTNSYRVIRPAEGDTAATLDLTLRPGVSRTVQLVDPDGRPVDGASAVGLRATGGLTRPPTAARLTATGLDPDHPRRVLFYHAWRRLSGTALLDGKTADPVTVRLEPLGGITGRLVNRDGTPAAGLNVLSFVEDRDVRDFAELRRKDEPLVRTDADGRFRIDGVPSGVALGVGATRPRDALMTHLKKPIQVKSGVVLDVGTLRATK